MKNKIMNTKTIMFAVLMAVLVIPAGALSVSAQQDRDEQIRTLFADIDRDIKSYVNSDMKDPNAKKAEIKERYAENLNKIIDLVAEKSQVQFSVDERENLKDLIIAEHMSEINRQKMVSEIPKDAVTETIVVDGLSSQGYFEIPAAYASGNPFPITTWKQVTVDINGGSGTDSAGNSYNIDGGNQFSILQTSYTPTKTTYTLTFADEDHPDPSWDSFWDNWRSFTYGRTTDIESFTVDSSGINFSGIWDNGKTFAEFYGQHGNKVRSYSSGVSVYISNVWNHAMDTSNTNSGMSITTWTT